MQIVQWISKQKLKMRKVVSGPKSRKDMLGDGADPSGKKVREEGRCRRDTDIIMQTGRYTAGGADSSKL
jgi:hypothetical protein